MKSLFSLGGMAILCLLLSISSCSKEQLSDQMENTNELEVLNNQTNAQLEVEHLSLRELNKILVSEGLEPIQIEEVSENSSRLMPTQAQCNLARNYGARLYGNPNSLTALDLVAALRIISFCGSSSSYTTVSEMINNPNCVHSYTSSFNAALNTSWIASPFTVLDDMDVDIMRTVILGYCN